MSIFGICAAGIAVCLAAQLLRESGGFRNAVIIFASAAIFIRISEPLIDIITQLRELSEGSGISDDELGILIRAVAICLISRLACDHCLDSGEQALSSQIDLAARAALVLNALPLLRRIIEIIKELLA
ncbi:MAG: hypothetical protein IKO44_02110 [Ruminococcus sp.]|nr:hypothetical protein [Ruminococcus sp.]